MRPRQTLCAAGMTQMAAWYWGMDLESGVPGSPSTSGGFSVADNRIHSCWGLQTGALTLKNKESFGGLRNRTEVKFPEWCPKLCGSISPRGETGITVSAATRLWRAGPQLYCSPSCHHLCHFWVGNQTSPPPPEAEASAVIHVGRNGSSRHCPPFHTTHFWIKPQVEGENIRESEPRSHGES